MTLFLQLETLETGIETYEQAQALKNRVLWEKFESVRVENLLFEWLETLSFRTRINYLSGVRRLTDAGLLNPMLNLQAFSLINHDSIIDKIKLVAKWKETSRQARAALYISFTRYLSRRFPGIFKKALPSREGTSKTFYRVHEKVATDAMNLAQWTAFLTSLEVINPRDCLIAKITLQGGKRIREVLNLTVDQINWEKREITFTQSKTKGMRKETVITYPQSIMTALRDLVKDHQGYVFLSRNEKPIMLNQIARTFSNAGRRAGISFKITPHVLRASCVTYLKSQGFSDSDIQKITGHSSSEMVNAYDKSARADNVSKKVSLVS